MVGYKDASGNNPTNRTADIAKESTAPAVRFGAAYDPSSVVGDFNTVARGLYIGGTGGNLNITGVDGVSVIFTGLVAGSIIDVHCIGTLTTSSTLTSVIPLY